MDRVEACPMVASYTVGIEPDGRELGVVVIVKKESMADVEVEDRETETGRKQGELADGGGS